MNVMRIITIILYSLLFSVSTTVIAGGKSDFDPDVTIRKREENGKVIFSKSGFAEKKTKTITPQPEVKKPRTSAPTVDVYYASWDPYSNKALDYFRENRIVVNMYDIEKDPEAAARKKRIDPNFVGLPLVIINDVVIRGVDEKKYKEALERPVSEPQ